MYSIQESVRVLKEYDPVGGTGNKRNVLKEIEDFMDSENNFHPLDVSVLKGIKEDDRQKVRELIRTVPLSHLLQEALGVSGTTGIAGAAYLVPDKIYDILYTSGAMNDIVPLAGPIYTCPGSSLKIDVEIDGQYAAHFISGMGKQPDETIQTTQITCTPKTFGINIAIDNSLIEDSQFDIMDFHVRRAGEQMGEFATQIWLADLITCGDGDGTQNSLSTGTANKTYLGDLAEAWNQNAQDKFISDTIICGPEPITDILADGTVSAYSDSFHTKAVNDSPLVWGSFMGMKVLMVKMAETYTGTGYLYIGSKWHSFVLDSKNAMATVRKRWLRIENYSDPIQDLVGASVTARQDQVSLYNDASCELTET